MINNHEPIPIDDQYLCQAGIKEKINREAKIKIKENPQQRAIIEKWLANQIIETPYKHTAIKEDRWGVSICVNLLDKDKIASILLFDKNLTTDFSGLSMQLINKKNNEIIKPRKSFKNGWILEAQFNPDIPNGEYRIQLIDV